MKILQKGIPVGDFMSMKLKELLFPPSTPTNADGYVDLSLDEYEKVLDEEPAATYIRVAELSNLDGISNLKKEIYDGNIVIVDISLIKRDQLVLERALHDLRDVVSDVHGDVAGLGDDLVITAPTGVRIDRTRIGGRTTEY